MKLFKYKTRNVKGRFASWKQINSEDVLSDKYFKHSLFGNIRRKVAEKVFKILIHLQR